MKKSYIISASVIFIVFCTCLFLLTHFSKASILAVDGYFVSGDEFSENLVTEKKVKKAKNIKLKKVGYDDSFYTNLNRLYVGEEKKVLVNQIYPIFSNDGMSLVNLDSKAKLINSKLEFFDSYVNATLTGGKLYNYGDLDQADYENYLFLQLSNMTYINLSEVKIKTFTREYVFPLHSIISFNEEFIKYYSYDGSGKLIYDLVDGLSLENKVFMGDVSFSYEDLLVAMEKIEKKEENKDEEVITPDLNIKDDYLIQDGGGKESFVDGEVLYVKPKVSVSEFTPNVYSARAVLNISDPAGVIVGGINFQFKIGDKIFLRKTFISSGNLEVVGLVPNTNFTIIGNYKYFNEKKKKMEVTFFEQNISTLGVEKLESIELDFRNGTVYSNKLEVKDIKIASDLSSETIKGVNKGIIVINGDSFSIPAAILQDLVRGKSRDYVSPAKLSSNKSIDYEFLLLDVFGNKIKIKNNKGSSRTSKEAPSVTLKVVSSEVNETTLSVNVGNTNDVSIHNMRYVVYAKNSTIVSDGKLDGSKSEQQFGLKSLDPNTTYTVKILGDYNIEDGNGVLTGQVMGEAKFTTLPLSSLGYIRVNSKVINLSYKSAELTSYVDIDTVSSILLDLLHSLKVTIYDKDDKVVYSKTYYGGIMESIRAGQPFVDNIEGLSATSEYKVEFSATIKQGSVSEEVSVLSALKDFKTYKRDATITISNRFVNGNMIDFDVSVIDLDGAIESERVVLEVRDKNEKLVVMESLGVNLEEAERLVYEKLEPNSKYTLTYRVESYNVGYDNSTFESDYILFKEEVITEEGIKGDIALTSLVRQITSKNLFNLEDQSRIRIDGNNPFREYDLKNRTVMFGAKNGYVNFAYFLPEMRGKEVTVSFKAKYDKDSLGTNDAYIAHTIGWSANYKIEGLSKTKWKDYKFTFKMFSDYIGFIVNEVANKNSRTDVLFKDIQILEGKNVDTSKYHDYSEDKKYKGTFEINLYDLRDEIVSDDYYIHIYLKDELVEEFKYDLEKNKAENIIKEYEFLKNKDYTIKLVVKVRNRFYEIDSVDFNTSNEIRGIRTLQDFTSMHSSGKYIVLNDLDFRKTNTTYGAKFYGEVDFQGYTVKINMEKRASYLFHTIASSGRIKNIVLDVEIDNITPKVNFYGFSYINEGIIDNLIINILSSTDLENQTISFASSNNHGTIQNFVINNKVPLYARARVGLLVWNNQGVVRNGYIYGENIIAYHEGKELRKDIGGLIGNADGNSRIENVFSLISVERNTEIEAENIVGNLIGNSQFGRVQNVYSVEDTEKGNTNIITQDPNIGRVNNIFDKNIFYSSSKNYGGKYSSKVSKMALYDEKFQDKVLNSNNGFEVKKNVGLGYYPQVKMHECMPKQEWIPLPKLTDADLVDVTSSEVVSNNGDSAVVKLYINNPGAEFIKEIGIKDINRVKILSQEDKFGKTELTIEISNPIKYQSKYYIRYLKLQPILGSSYEKTYGQFERAIDIDLYYPIKNLNDWKKINENLSQNYMLIEDLDFSGVTMKNYVVNNTFSGKFNGNGHTIRNIEITVNNGMFNTLAGTIENLFVENYKKTNQTAYGGFIYSATPKSIVDNVHITNVIVAGTNRVGGIVGNGYGMMIRNSSITNFKNITDSDKEDIVIGGIAGWLYSASIIQNCFVQDVNIDITNSISTNGIGGLVGRMDNGVIENSYATGNIKSNSVYVGGLVGAGGVSISKVWTNVDIQSELDFVGGIIGNTSSNIANSLVAGAIFSSYNGININRTSGNQLRISQNNYAWIDQPYFGYITGDATLEQFLTTEQLSDANTYYEIINFGNQFDYSEVSSRTLPRLKNADTGELLPNQKDSKFLNEEFDVLDMQIEPTVTNATIRIELDNPNNVEVTGVEFDYLNVDKAKIITADGISVVEVEVSPKRFYDNYALTTIRYSTGNGPDKTYTKHVQVKVTFYKTISKFEDWQNISKTTTENYRLSGDVDFAGKTNINANVSIGRLEGQGNGYSIKNLTITTDKKFSLIRKIITTMKNVTFENINIISTYNGNYTGIIDMNYANVDDVQFNNITIEASKSSYVAPMLRNRAYDMRNISISGNKITGNNNVAGFLASSYANDISSVSGKNCVIYGTGSSIGGIIASKNYAALGNLDFKASNMHVTGKTDVGGIFGYGGSIGASIINSTVVGLDGGNYIGAMSGRAGQYNTKNVEVRDCTVLAKGNNYVGGLAGWAYDIEQSNVYNTTVIQEGINYKYTGGLAGNKTGHTIKYSGVHDSVVTSAGIGTGGLIGGGTGGYSVYYDYVYNTEVNGVDQVGGLIGYADRGNIHNNITNARVNASGSYVGGIIGYINQIHENDSVYSSLIYNNILANSEVVGRNYVGGFAGYIPDKLNDNFFYANVIVGNISTNISDGAIGSVTGFDNHLESEIPRFYIYDKNLINGEEARDMESLTLKKENLISAEDLRLQDKYTSIGFNKTYWDFEPLNRNFYPKLKNITAKQDDISLPIDRVGYSFRSTMVPNNYELPTYQLYSSGVNTLNIEFDKVDGYSYFEVYSKDKLVFSQDIEKRVYSMYYNYTDDLEIVIGGGFSKKTKRHKASDLVLKTSTFENKYAYIHDGFIKGNVDGISDKVIHLYGDKVLTEKLDIYDLSEGEFISKNNTFDATLLAEVVPLYKFRIDKSLVDTYAMHSVIHKDSGDIIFDKQIFIKNGEVEIIDSFFDNAKNTVLIDNHGKKNYVSVLGTDGRLYHLKEEIKTPVGFDSDNIQYMSHNLDSKSSVVVIMYKTGKTVVFDYRTGKIIEEAKADKKVSFINYFKENIKSRKSLVPDSRNKLYNDSLELKKKLEEKPIIKSSNGEYLITDTEVESKDDILIYKPADSKYVTYYNAITKNYDVLDLGVVSSKDEVTNNDLLVITENDKIYSSSHLIDFYLQETIFEKIFGNIPVLGVFGFILVGILIALILWLRNIKLLKEIKEE